MTARDLGTEALQEIGFLGVGETADGDTGALVLGIMQGMVDAMQAKGLVLYAEQRATYSLVASQQTRTIGSGGNFDGTRPIFIARDSARIIPVGDTFELPLRQYSRQEWYDERLKSQTDSYPQAFLYEPFYPSDVLGTFTFWPIPTTAASFVFAYGTPLTTPATLDTVLVFPPGYREAWKYNLAKKCARPFGKGVTPDLADDAATSLGLIERMNDPGPPPSRSDNALCGRGGFDIRNNRSRA